jgi:hypothetical protein
MAFAAAALACMTVSGMSFGSWNAPAGKTPGRDVSRGRSSLVKAKPQRLSRRHPFKLLF